MSDLNTETWGDMSPSERIGTLTESLAEAQEKPVATGEGWAIYRDGSKVDWRDLGDRPHQKVGSVQLDEPASFAEFVMRHALPESALYASRSYGTVVAVLDDHPAVEEVSVRDGFRPEAGRQNHRAALLLTLHDDWRAWVGLDGRLVSQRDFGEFLEAQAHNVLEPSSATMLEVATTLTAKRSLDFASRVRLDNGDMEFKFTEETQMKAGRNARDSVEIPTKFTITVPVWEGTEQVTVEARLRVRAEQDGVRMGYKLIRTDDARRTAFTGVLADIREGIPEHVPVFLGAEPGRR